MPAFLKQKKNLYIFGLIFIVIIVAGAAFFVLSMGKVTKTEDNQTSTASQNEGSNTTNKPTASDVTWQFSGSAWTPSSTAPTCNDPLIPTLPVNLESVTSILYPGQTRGGNYKAHGGFRFGSDNNISVTLPLDASVTEGSRYIESGEVQYMFTFINSCGIAYRFDHLHTLSEKFQTLANQLPEAKVDDSRTTPFNPPVKVTKGEIVATKVGFVNTKNVGVDFGVYDLRTPNAASKNAGFAAAHENFKQYIFYGTCWLKELPTDISQKVLALPAGDSANGKTSDYCK